MTRRPVLLLLLLLVAASAMFGQVIITSTSPLPQGYAGINYTYTFTASVSPPSLASGLTWSLAAAPVFPLPPGFQLSSNGTLSGFTTQAGTYNFTVIAQASSFTTTMPFTLVIGVPSVVINTTSPLPNAFVGPFYTDTLSASSNPAGVTWSISQGPLPPGLNLSSNGVLSGNPTQSGVFTFTLAASIPNTKVFSTQAYTLTVYAGQLTINTTSLPNAVVGKAYSAALAANQNGVTWAVSGTLPPGINFNTATGVFGGGTSTLGAYPLQITATLTNYPTATTNLTLYVTSGPLSIPQPSLPPAVQGSAYTTTVTAAGGLPPYQFAFSNTSNDSLSMSSGGIITGTPTTSGSFFLLTSLSDATGQSVQVNLSLFVASPLSVLTTSLPNGNVGVAYSAQLQGGGGTAPLTWTVQSGVSTLPPGLTISNAGIISGTPTAAGLYPFTVQATDTGGRTANARLSIAVSIAAISITTNSLPNALLGVAYAQTLGVSGGDGSYTWRLASGALPQGLILDPAKPGTIDGTPTGALGTSTFSIQVSDTSSPVLTTTKAFTINVALTLSITTLSLPNGTVGTAYPATSILVSGGSSPYTWSVTSGSLPPGLALNANTGAITGTPTAAGTSQFTVTVNDSGGQTVNSQFNIAINATTSTPLSITTTSFSATVGTPVSQTLSATGGTPPYTWSATGLPSWLTLSGNTLSGEPPAAGNPVTVGLTVTDSAKITATTNITITIIAVPTVTIGTIGGAAATQTAPTFTLSSAFPVPLNGKLTANFVSSVGGSPTEVGFVSSNGGLSPTANFTVAANAANAVFANTPVLATGTVAGTITLTATLTTADGTNVTPSPAPTETVTIPAAAPVLQSVAMSTSGSTITVTAIGYSTSREMVSGSYQFYTSSGPVLSPVSVPLSSQFATWYQSSASNPYGSQFTVTVPFTITGSASAITSVNVSLTNSKGTSNSLQTVP